jgi:hypothetical protein
MKGFFLGLAYCLALSTVVRSNTGHDRQRRILSPELERNLMFYSSLFKRAIPTVSQKFPLAYGKS